MPRALIADSLQRQFEAFSDSSVRIGVELKCFVQRTVLSEEVPSWLQIELSACTGGNVAHLFLDLWSQEEGQDIAEYAVMLAVILVLVVGTIRLVGSNANNAFSAVASSIQ